jgi:hypothetical protein
MKIAVITSAVGVHNNLLPPKYSDVADYHAFLADNISAPGWNVHKALDFSCDPVYKNRRNAKVYKIIPHLFLPEYDYYFWIDATHSLEEHPHDVIEKYLKDTDVAVFKHQHRDCIYEESEHIKEANYDHLNLLDDQVAFYKEMDYPCNNGLYELPARVQKNTELTQRMGLMWWEQICMFSSRDQVSFPFVLYQLNIKPSILPGYANNIRGNSIMPQLTNSSHRRINNV